MVLVVKVVVKNNTQYTMTIFKNTEREGNEVIKFKSILNFLQ